MIPGDECLDAIDIETANDAPEPGRSGIRAVDPTFAVVSSQLTSKVQTISVGNSAEILTAVSGMMRSAGSPVTNCLCPDIVPQPGLDSDINRPIPLIRNITNLIILINHVESWWGSIR